MIKQSIDFAHLVVNLQDTMKALKASDSAQQEKIQQCIEAVKVLAARYEGQEKRLDMLEQRFLSLAVSAIKRVPETRSADTDTSTPALLPAEPQKPAPKTQ